MESKHDLNLMFNHFSQLGHINFNEFYSVSIRNYKNIVDISLQGHFSSLRLVEYKKMGFELKLDENTGFVRSESLNFGDNLFVSITLT